LEDKSLEHVLRVTSADSGQANIFNSASEIWNHTFFFKCLTPLNNEPDADMMQLFDLYFGGYDEFRKQVY
jgi:Fe-Mn family superoxide dismutase